MLDDEKPILNLETRGPTAQDPSETQDWLANHYPVRVGGQVIGVGVDITDRKRLGHGGSALTDAAETALSATTQARDPYTAGRQCRVTEVAIAVAIEPAATATPATNTGKHSTWPSTTSPSASRQPLHASRARGGLLLPPRWIVLLCEKDLGMGEDAFCGGFATTPVGLENLGWVVAACTPSCGLCSGWLISDVVVRPRRMPSCWCGMR